MFRNNLKSSERTLDNIRENYAVTKQGSYFMNAAIGGVHKEVVGKAIEWMSLCHTSGAVNDIRFFNLLEEARSVAGEFIGVEKDDVAFSSSTSLNMNYFAQMLKDKNIKKIVTPSVEFPSSTIAWFHHGYEVDLVEQREGRIWIEDIIERSETGSTAVVVSGVQYLTGQRLDLVKLSEELESKGIPLIINATQLIGQLPIDLSKLKYLAFTASLHKWLGADLGLSLISIPKENREELRAPIAGWTSVKEPWLLLNQKPDLVEDMGAFQLGTMPFNMIAAAKKAMEVQLDIGRDAIALRVLENSQKLSDIIIENGYEMLSPRENNIDRTGICTFLYEKNLEEALMTLEKAEVFCNGRKGSIRASIHFYNNDEDIERFRKAISLI